MNTEAMERVTILGQLAADAELLACGPDLTDEERNILRMQAAEFRTIQFEELRVEQERGNKTDYLLAMLLRPGPNVSHKSRVGSFTRCLLWSGCASLAAVAALGLGYWLVRRGAAVEVVIGLAAVAALWKPVTAKL